MTKQEVRTLEGASAPFPKRSVEGYPRSHTPRTLEGCQARFAQIGQRLDVQIAGCNDVCNRNLSPRRMSFTHNGSLGNGRLFHEKLFDLARVNIETTGNDQSALAPAQREIAVR